MSPTKKRAARSGRKRGAKRSTAGRATPKRATRAKRRAAAKPARRAPVKKAARAAGAERPVRSKRRKAAALALVPTAPRGASNRRLGRPRAAHAPAPAFPQREGASAKQLVLFELMRARAAVHSAIAGLSPAAADEPLGPGKWSVRESVLHLVTWDQARLREMEAALRGTRASWEGSDDAEMARLNEETLAALRRLPWDEALRLLHATRQELLEELESVPEEPAEVWSEEHPFGWMLQRLPDHDRHHAEIIKQWRAAGGP